MYNTATIPAKPEGQINPAELSVADALLDTMSADLVPEEKHPTLYERIAARYGHLKEEAWHRLFGHTEPAPKEAKIIQMTGYGRYYEHDQSL